ncbi:4Fe-4S ferredoxin [Denitrobacterium detoxificans]|uniref:Ferredoxin-type protein NapH n=1 Tax=Denitrobacterium detoxificans TaxID=79604 RepID=A0A172RZG0_9ACTN|nr:4Fe-4S binding protein [Denitrobacterium detoxificans]ANE23108.1 4Fe-4S ferredoxin [Denitrobacterium detoxificans]SEO53411.1 ferredoxin-type protein NapH [Denitrobacterium detoxificans]
MKKSSVLRTISVLCVLGIVCVGLAFHTGVGTPSQWGLYDITAICPLGALETLIASKTFVPPALIALAITVVVTVILGRAFCAWGCPVPLVKRLFGADKRHAKAEAQAIEKAESDDAEKSDCAACASAARCAEVHGEDADGSAKASGKSGVLSKLFPANVKRGGLDDSRNWVLGGTLLTTAVFGFPVFCLICPVGLSFATIIALWRLLQLNETTLSLVVFPALLIVEVVVLRSWCHRFCPLGALLSLISRANRTFRPKSDASVCLKESKGQKCDACAKACPEGIDLHDAVNSQPMHDCTKCRKCADACPVHAITFPLRDLASKKSRMDKVEP